MSNEDPAKRTPYSTVYNNPDGTKTPRAYDSVAFVPDGQGRLVPLDRTLARQSDGRIVPMERILGRMTNP